MESMEGSSNQACGSSSAAASKYLTNLPSRVHFSSTVPSSNLGRMRVYVCEHETAPPENQLIHTDQKNILIRSLTLRKQKGESGSKNAKIVTSGEGSRKRASERLLDGGTSAKKPQTSSRQEGSSSNVLDMDLHCLTVERLRALLKERGLPARGKKDELIARLKNGTS